MKYILIFLSIIFLISCGKWERYVQSKCHTSTHDSTYSVETLIHDTTFVNVPYSELLFDTVANDIPYNVVIHHEEKKNGLNASFDIKHSKITFRCVQDSLKVEIDYLKKQIETVKSSTVEVFIPCDLKHHSGWDSFCNWFTGLSLFFALVWVVIRALK